MIERGSLQTLISSHTPSASLTAVFHNNFTKPFNMQKQEKSKGESQLQQQYLAVSKNKITVSQQDAKTIKVINSNIASQIASNNLYFKQMHTIFESDKQISTAGLLNKRQKEGLVLDNKAISQSQAKQSPKNFFFPELLMQEEKQKTRISNIQIKKHHPPHSSQHSIMLDQKKDQMNAQDSTLKSKSRIKERLQPLEEPQKISPTKKKMLPVLHIAQLRTKKTEKQKLLQESGVQSPQQKENDNDKPASASLLQIAYATSKGSSPHQNKVNQDSLIVKKHLSGLDNCYLLAIADGHGVNGHLVSKHIKKILVQILEFEDKRIASYKYKEKNPASLFLSSPFSLEQPVDEQQTLIRQLLTKVVLSVNKQIESQRSFNVTLSGSTLVIAIVTQKFIVTSNCGDSRFALFDSQGIVLLETVDHKPELPQEKQRIEQQFKGRVKRQIDLVGSHNHTTDHKSAVARSDSQGGPYRVWQRDVDMPGLAMSRSIGDTVAKQLGVIAEPDIQFYHYDQGQPFALVIASDGIWDVLECNEIGEILSRIDEESDKPSSSPKDIVNYIMQHSHGLWLDLPQNTKNLKKFTPEIDDTTMILALFNFKNQQ